MRSRTVLQCCLMFLLVGSISSFGLVGIIFGAIEGFTKGVIKGSIGAFSPVAQHGFNSMKKALSTADFGGNGFSGLSNNLGNILNPALQQVFSNWSSVMAQLFNNGGGPFANLLKTLKSLAENLFSIFGSMSSTSRLQVNHMIVSTGNSVGSVIRQKLETQNDPHQIKQEILAVQKIMESKHPNPSAMVKAIKTQAPVLSAIASDAYLTAHKKFKKHMKILNPSTKSDIQKMQLIVRKAELDMTGLMSSVMGMLNGGGGTTNSLISTATNLLSNLFSAFRMFM